MRAYILSKYSHKWYDRDITTLCKYLQLEVVGVPNSETMDVITKFLFIGKPLQYLGQYDLVIVL